ncbi:MAG: segregation and condensation protein B [Gammaproteobacteria bacterium]|jgi:segregation and condensation protein B
MNDAEIKRIIEVALLTAEYSLPLEEIVELLATDGLLDEQSSPTQETTAQLSAPAQAPTIVQPSDVNVASRQAVPREEPSAVELGAQVPGEGNRSDDQACETVGLGNAEDDASESLSGAERPSPREIRAVLRAQVRVALGALAHDCAERGVDLVEVASGYRYQVKASHSHWVSRLHAERPTRYSRALLETLALVAYRQPVTRGEIEDIRGVGVSSSIMKTLHEREWIRVLGHREVPGRPAMYGTTGKFLDDFNLQRLDQLPPLAEIRELENLHADLFPGGGEGNGNVGDGTARAPNSQLRIAVGTPENGDEGRSAESGAAQTSDAQVDALKSDSPEPDSPEPDSPEPGSPESDSPEPGMPEPESVNAPSSGPDLDGSEVVSEPSSQDDISQTKVACTPSEPGMGSSCEPTGAQVAEHAEETSAAGEGWDASAEVAPNSQSPDANVRTNTDDEQSSLTPGTDADPTSNVR